MKEILKGNYKVRSLETEAVPEKPAESSLEEQFEAAAFEKLGGSITFIKKSASFIWKGKRDA